ncbi:Bag family molecular chaperone regulator [Thalictrum thalictroides]|uniref:Bag family molecular chaperone regulator n=1 Tax=Thalictrum thalictroides TaxID=46969 RepID=A0A7J6W0W7_THATH|nr:Bag family molecular chaperone regulator [Thalictrum thalictroides]
MVKLRSLRFSISRSNSKINVGVSEQAVSNGCKGAGGGGGEIKWELRPGGMLVQKREDGGSLGEALIKVRVSTVSRWHDISIEATSTFGELKMVLALVTGLEPREQRLLYRGKEREDGDYLHMVGVKDMDKVLLLEDPAIKERKLRALAMARSQVIGNPCCTIKV